MRRAYERSTGETLAASGFYARFSRELVQLLKRLVDDAMVQLQQQRRLEHALAGFEQLLVAEGSLIRLHKSLAGRYPSVFPNKVGAAAKLHVVINVGGRSARSVQLTAGSRHASTILKVGSWVRSKLLVLDLAYRKGLILEIALSRRPLTLERRLLRVLRREAVDPNRNRPKIASTCPARLSPHSH